jgi:hypothetical protein
LFSLLGLIAAVLLLAGYVICLVKNIIQRNRKGGGALHFGLFASVAMGCAFWGVYGRTLGFWSNAAAFLIPWIITWAIEIARQEIMK